MCQQLISTARTTLAASGGFNMPASRDVTLRIASVMLKKLGRKTALELLVQLEDEIEIINGSSSVSQTFSAIKAAAVSLPATGLIPARVRKR
jgi:hypothetical protein